MIRRRRPNARSPATCRGFVARWAPVRYAAKPAAIGSMPTSTSTRRWCPSCSKGPPLRAAGARADLASRRATQARALWRGEPLLDLADGGVRVGEAARLDELHRRSVGDLDRCGARARAPRCDRRGDRVADRRASVRRAVVGPADDRAVPRRTPGRRAACLRASPNDRCATISASTRHRRSPASSSRSCIKTPVSNSWRRLLRPICRARRVRSSGETRRSVRSRRHSTSTGSSHWSGRAASGRAAWRSPLRPR